jgi:hypothetical protein
MFKFHACMMHVVATHITLVILHGPPSFDLVSQKNLKISKNAMEVQFTTCEFHRFYLQ